MAYIDNVTNILQIQPDGLPTFVRLSQNENGRNLYFQLAGNEIDIPANATITISGTKPDGTVYSGTGSISDNVILIPEMIQMTAVAGYWDAKVKIISGGNTIATGRIRFVIDADTVDPGSVPSDSELEGLVAEAQQYAETARTEAYGSPLTATTAAGMTDHTRVYVYTGSETGYTAGHWYYWDDTQWTDGGIYNSTATNTDPTLTLAGVPADAKATGDKLTGLKEDLSEATGYRQITIQPTDSEPYAGYWFYNTNLGTITLGTSTAYYTIEHPVDISALAVGSKVSVLSSLTGVYGVYIADENYNVIDFINGNNAVENGYEVTANLQLVTTIVPTNAKYIVSHIRTTKYTGMTDFNVFAYAKLYVEELETRVEALETEIDEIEASRGLKEYTITPNFTDGYYVTINNVLAESNSYSYTDYIDVKPFKEIDINWYFSGSGAAMVFLSEDRETIIAAYRATDLGTSPSTITVPEGAAWFRTSERTIKKAEFSLVGTMDYIDSVYDLTSATVPHEEQPLDRIIHDGGFCRIFDKIGVVGDSLASGSIARPNSESHSEADEDIVDLIWYSWIQQISRYTGSTAFNFSMGGLAARGLRYGTSNPNVQEILANLENNDKKCKMYYVALGHNDYNYMVAHPGEYPIGTIADCNLADPSQNANSYYGNYAWVISKIKSIQPRAKIFLITMKNRTIYGDFNAAIRDMIGLFNTYYENTDVYLIDMEGVPIETSWEYYEGHGSPQGYLNYSYQISSYVDFIIRHNQNDFKTVPYIGTSYLI